MTKEKTKATISMEMTLAEMQKVIGVDVENLNKCIIADKASAIASAKEALDSNLKVYNTKLRREEFDKFLSEEDPIIAALTQRDIVQYVVKREKEDGTVKLEDGYKMVSLPEFARFARQKGNGVQVFASEDCEITAETAACMLSKFLHKNIKSKDVFTWETKKKIEVTNCLTINNMRTLLQCVLDDIHEGFELEDDDWEVIRSTMTRKLSGYKDGEKGYVLKAVTAKTVFNLLTDMASKALNGYNYSLEAIEIK